MRKIIVCLAMLTAVLAGCATDATVRSSPKELPGTYYSGDGLGRNVTVVLNSNGTYSSDWQGCLGVYGKSSGIWLLHGEHLVFEPLAETGDLAGYLTQATTIRHKGRLGFVRDQNLKQDRVSEQLVFLSEPSQP